MHGAAVNIQQYVVNISSYTAVCVLLLSIHSCMCFTAVNIKLDAVAAVDIRLHVLYTAINIQLHTVYSCYIYSSMWLIAVNIHFHVV